MVSRLLTLSSYRTTLAMLLLLSSALAVAHPYHQSLLELTLDTQTRQLHGALKLLPEDFERIDKNHQIDKYLQSSLRLNSNGQNLPLKLEGIETDPRAVWIYLSWPAPPIPCAAAPLTVENHILFEVNDHFVNTVRWLEAGEHGMQPKAHNLTPSQPKLQLNLSRWRPDCAQPNKK